MNNSTELKWCHLKTFRTRASTCKSLALALLCSEQNYLAWAKDDIWTCYHAYDVLGVLEVRSMLLAVLHFVPVATLQQSGVLQGASHCEEFRYARILFARGILQA